MKVSKKRIAVLDIGTNTFHILIAELDSTGHFESIHREKIPVKLGQGGINQNIITDEAIVRAKNAFNYFNELTNSFQITDLRSIATSAVRNAENGEEFVKMAKKLFNISIDIIDGNREAELIYKGVKKAVLLDSSKTLIIDIGGGSVEFIICNKSTIFWKKSFEIGGQRLVEKFHQKEPISQSETELLLTYLEQELNELNIACTKYEPTTLIGASGAFETLSDIYYNEHYITGSIVEKNYHILPKPAFQKIHNELIIKTRNERLAISGMIEMRVDMIVVSSHLINYVLEKSKITKILTSNYALKEGILSELVDTNF